MPDIKVEPITHSKIHKPKQHQRRPKAGFLIPLFFITAAAGVILALWIAITNKGKPEVAVPSSSPEILKANALSPNQDPPALTENPVIEAPPIAPPSEDYVAPAQRAYKCLEEFLKARTLEERLPMIESKLSPEQLAQTVIAEPLPHALRYATELQQKDPIENLIDVYCSVDFDAGTGLANPQTVLIRMRGESEPKVVVDPFLDLFGGRLAAYASNKTEKGGTFQVIASPVAHCYNKNVPNREQKLTLKLLARDNTAPIAEAFFSKFSKIGEMLDDDGSGFRYGQAQACTILLRWNLDEDPEKPYLEALDIQELNWNP